MAATKGAGKARSRKNLSVSFLCVSGQIMQLALLASQASPEESNTHVFAASHPGFNAGKLNMRYRDQSELLWPWKRTAYNIVEKDR